MVLKREPTEAVAPVGSTDAAAGSAQAPTAVHYAAQLFTPDAEWGALVCLELAAGRIDIPDWQLLDVAVGKQSATDAPPDWLVDQLRAMLRAAWRNAAASRAPGQLALRADQLPRRITRWRAPPADSHVMPDARRAPKAPAAADKD